MKTRWGSCNQKAGRIWLNLELAKKPVHCLEYVIVHELLHLIEENYWRFAELFAKYQPKRRSRKEELNRIAIQGLQKPKQGHTPHRCRRWDPSPGLRGVVVNFLVKHGQLAAPAAD